MKNILAELSLYPLRQPKLSPVIDEALRVLGEKGLAFEMRSMNTLVCGNEKTIFEALHEIWALSAASGDVVMHVTLSNACPGSGSSPSQPGS